MPTFTSQQTVFSLSMLSGLGHCLSGSVGSIEPQLTQMLETQLGNLQPQIGTWELAWGPAVYELPTSNRPDNVMYVARCSDPGASPQIVVAIAGTNPYSFPDWLVEDFLVSAQVPWVYGGFEVALTSKIALGTFIGLSVLQTLKPGAGQPGAGSTLKDFLATQAGSPVQIAVSGHSLGGALSATVALWLHDIQSEWDPAGNASLSALPSAGPTAGNKAFAEYSDSQIGASVTRLHNAIDVVPHAWYTPDLRAVPTLYAPTIQPDDLINGFADLAIAISAAGDYTQINASAPALPGTVNTSPPVYNPAASSFVNFLQQAGFQHVDAYYDMLGVQILGPILQCVKESVQLTGPGSVAERLEEKLAKFRA